MRYKIVVYPLLLLVLGIVAATFGERFLTGAVSEGTVPAAPKEQYLAAARSLEPGFFLESKDLEWREPAPDATDGGVEGIPKTPEAIDSIAGAVLCSAVAKGQFLSPEDFVRPGEAAFLAAVLKPATRAVTIRVDDVTGGAGLIRPGNKVDVILSGQLNGTASPLPAAQTLLQDVRVIAVNRDTGTGTLPPGVRRESSGETAAARQNAAKGTITLEVNPKEVEILAVAKSLGTLSLSLRSLSDRKTLLAPAGAGGTSASELVNVEKASPKRQIVTLYGSDQSR
jgi:pilus assembly protein CpaB